MSYRFEDQGPTIAARFRIMPPEVREACERIADMLRQDDGEAFFEAEKFLKRHAPDLYDKIGISGGTCDLQMREDEDEAQAEEEQK